MSAVSIQLTPASIAAWHAASEASSSAPPQRPPNTQVPSPMTDSSRSVPPSRRRSISCPLRAAYWGVSATSNPPSSSYAGKKSAVAGRSSVDPLKR